jgi:DHA2 family multidrug resistance protein-like MFS transporter
MLEKAAANAPSPPVTDGLPWEQRRWAVTAIFTALAMGSLDTMIANVALPAIAADLHVNPADVVWVVNVYQIAIVASLLPLGALGDIVGHQRLYLAGVLLFTLASLGCACAWSLPSLLVARTLQGLGASATMAVNTALVRFVYPSRMLGRGFGHNAMVVATAFTFGPSIASAILALGPWPWLFAINVPLGLISFLIGIRTLPATPRAAHRFRRRGAGSCLPRSLHCRDWRRWPSGLARRGHRHPDRGPGVRLGPDAQACGSSGADAADRPVPPSAVRIVGVDSGLLLRRAGPHLRGAAVLF